MSIIIFILEKKERGAKVSKKLMGTEILKEVNAQKKSQKDVKNRKEKAKNVKLKDERNQEKNFQCPQTNISLSVADAKVLDLDKISTETNLSTVLPQNAPAMKNKSVKENFTFTTPISSGAKGKPRITY